MDVPTTRNHVTHPSQPNAAKCKPRAASHKASAADTKPNASSTKTSPVTADARPSPKPRSGTAGAKPRAANSDTTASNKAKVPSTPKPRPGPTKPDAPLQPGPTKLDVILRKTIQSIDAAGKAMSVARANVELAKYSKENQNKVVAKANQVVGALLTPSRHVVNLLSELGALFPPCKQVSSTLAALIKNEVSRNEKDVRVAIVHFDLARALAHIGSLNRKSRPTRSIGEPLNKLLRNFKNVIQDFSQFCEDYYETRAPKSAVSRQQPSKEHLRHWKSNRDSLKGIADRIARLKKGMISLLAQQAVQHPGKHTDVLAQIESRLAKNRAFYFTIRDASEEIAEARPSKQLKEKEKGSVRPVQDVTKGISSTIKKPTASTRSTLKQVQERVAKTSTRRGVKSFSASAPHDTLNKSVSGERQRERVDTKSGHPRRPERIHKQDQAPVTKRAPARGQRTGQQEKTRTSETRGKPQTSLVQGQQVVNTNAKLDSRSNRSRNVAGKEGNTAERSVLEAELPYYGQGTVGQGLGDDDDYQQLYCLQGDEIAGELGVHGEGDQEPYHLSEGDSGDGGAYYEDPGLRDDYGGESAGDGEGGQEPDYDSDAGSGDGGFYYDEPGLGDDSGGESGGDGEGGQEPDYDSDADSGDGGAYYDEPGLGDDSGSASDGEGGQEPDSNSDTGSGDGGAYYDEPGLGDSGSASGGEGSQEPDSDSDAGSGDGGAYSDEPGLVENSGSESGGDGEGGQEPDSGSDAGSGDGGGEDDPGDNFGSESGEGGLEPDYDSDAGSGGGGGEDASGDEE